MKFSKILLLSAAALSLAACGNNDKEEPTPSPELVEVDFETFKSKTLNLTTSPYDLVSTHYHAFGSQGTYPIDIDKTVSLTKISAEWTIDVAPTHYDYACASECKQILDSITLAKIVQAGAPTDGTEAKFYYNEELGFKLVANGFFNDNGSTVTSSTIGEWNKYGDLTKYDTHTVDSDLNPENSSDVHVVTEFTYSTKVTPPPAPPSGDEENIKAIKDGLDSLLKLNTLTCKMEESSEMTGMGKNSSTEYSVLNNGEFYLKPSKDQYSYEAITKVGEKFVYAYFYNREDGYTEFTYVDQNHAKKKELEYIDCGLIEAIDYLYQVQSFEKFGDHLVETALGYQFIYTKADYTIDVKKSTLDNGDSNVLITMAMTPEWCTNNLYEGMPLSNMSLSCGFSYNDDYLTSFTNSQVLSVSVSNETMSMIMDIGCSYSDVPDQTIINDVKAVLATKEIPEVIENEQTRVKYKINGYEIDMDYIADYTDKTSFNEAVQNALHGVDSKLSHALSSAGSQVDVVYYHNDEKVDSLNNLVPSSYQNEIDIKLTPKAEEKCYILYEYEDRQETEFGWSGETDYKSVIADKSASYQILTSFEGKEYKDQIAITEYNTLYEGTTIDISNLDTLIITCRKIAPYVPDPIANKLYKYVEITNFDDIKDLELPNGGGSVGDSLATFMDTRIVFTKSEAMWNLNSVDNITIVGNFCKTDTPNLYSISFDYSNYGPIESPYYAEISYNSTNGDITVYLDIETTTDNVKAAIVFEIEQVA